MTRVVSLSIVERAISGGGDVCQGVSVTVGGVVAFVVVRVVGVVLDRVRDGSLGAGVVVLAGVVC